MPNHAIAISNLHKAYGSLRVLRGVDLDIASGEVFGLLGPNGVGKTTLTHTILGLLKPDDGHVQVFGSNNPSWFSAYLGYLPERQRYHPHFTGREYLKMLGRLSGLSGGHLQSHVEAVLKLVGLEQAANRRIGTYSKGMLQRIGLAQAVLHKPPLLIVDEPASGLDPSGQRDMALLLQTLKENGHTIFLCTHQLTNIARLCDRVGVLIGGQIRYTVSLAELYTQGHSMTVQVANLPPHTANALYALGPQVRCNRVSVTLYPASDQLLANVLRRLLDDNIAIRAVVPEADALEQFYMRAIQSHAAMSPSIGAREEHLQPMTEDH
jgi:ABC-2 type transport system ATP-binding protein